MKETLNEIVKGGLLPNPVSFVAQLISTFVLFYFLKSKVWKPMQGFLEKRKEVIVGELESARKLNEEAQKNKDLTANQLENAKAESMKMVDFAKVQAQETKDQMLKEAEKQAHYKISKAEKEIEQQRILMERDMKTQAVEIAFAAAEKLIHENLDDSKNRKMIENFIEEVGE
jgi:F-type H+-transporting ATPase subunit b